MTILMAIAGPLLRLSMLLAMLFPMVGINPVRGPSRPLDVHISATQDTEGQPNGRQVLMVEGRPFFPIGVSYHFTRHRDTWDEDLQSMRDLGLNTVRIDLAWRDVAPLLPGRYRFGVLDEFLDRAAMHGLYVVPVFSHTTQDFNTPLWFWAIERGWRVEDQNGHAPLDDLPSVNHPGYRQGLRSYIAATAQHIKDHPAILAYQLLNEPRYDSKRLYDYNPNSVEAFRQWLQQKYGTIGRLNRVWSTSYYAFEEVAPLRDVEHGRPIEGPLLRQWSDWRQFGYDNLADFLGDLAHAVKGVDPNHPVIVAEMAWWWWGEQPYTGVSPLHVYRYADIVGYDLYPEGIEDANYFLLTSDMLLRYWEKPVWVMELNRKDGDPTGEEVQTFASKAIEGGATGLFYFQWRDDLRDGGRYGVLEEKGGRRTQYGGLASTVRWLKGKGESLATAPPPNPDLYLVWPSSAVGEVSGIDSPAWQIFDTARRILDGGLRLGLVMEDLIHAVSPEKLLNLRDGRLEIGKSPSPTPPPSRPARGILFPEH